MGCVVAAALSVAPDISAQDYPQWRGVNRDGSASSFVEPKVWPEKLTLHWKIEVGEGYATPLIIGNTVYVFTRRDGNEGITAVDAATGSQLWRSEFPASFSPTQAAAVHGIGPKATPLFHEGKLFTLGISGVVAAFDATSAKLLWRTEAPAEPPFFSAASSPVAHDGMVLTHPGNYGPLTAFDAQTGQLKWSAGAGGFFQSPLIASFEGIRQAVSVTQTSVIGVSLPEGKVLWEFPFPGAAGGTMPLLYGDSIIVSALDTGTTCFQPRKGADGKWTAAPLWHTLEVSMYVSNPVVVGDMLIGLSRRSSGQFFVLDARSGKVLWLGPPREAENVAIAKSGDLLFLLKDSAELIVARGTPQEVLKRYTVSDSPTWAQPTISGNRIYIKDVSSLSLWTID
jgi:outer membrane protein assembly factor BamB